MSDNALTPERAARLLRAKAHELEALVTANSYAMTTVHMLAADIALVASLLADHIERTS
jgi:hypothetical protein